MTRNILNEFLKDDFKIQFNFSRISQMNYLNNVGSVQTVDAIDTEHAILSANESTIVSPTETHFANNVSNRIYQNTDIFVVHATTKKNILLTNKT